MTTPEITADNTDTIPNTTPDSTANQFFAIMPPGMEGLAAAELKALSAHDINPVAGGVEFSGSMDTMMRVNLRARCITRVLLRLASFKALSFPELYNKSKRVDWQRYFAEGAALSLRASCHGSRLLHSGRVEQAVLDAIRDGCIQVTAGSGETEPAQQILIRVDKDRCTISIDCSGERLDRRGYRLHSGMAPLRETIAAGILQWMEWQPDEVLLTPMCGSGTFAIEAALMAAKRAPGLAHDFAFLHWPSLKQKRWQRVLQKAEAMAVKPRLHIYASDLDGRMLAQARHNAKDADVSELIDFNVLDIARLAPPAGVAGGLIIVNPPYGGRIEADARAIYAMLGKVFREHFSGWRMMVIVPDQGCERALAIPVKRRLKVKHGGHWVHMLHLDIN
ncbi:MAG: RNA methyltransferase [Zetaproteobacteria bacterium CG_4_9_14_3_um_filter_54_145]|nr:MAG: RNA methyltransferase [Zetaproteobacteria bacterium CG_4_10_14_3_um_filter_54_28]PJA29402.1 MAG: RNA methyltransferase [Zetaproteobacteria bacterium CG_4_9_14_3_um_filter_54_145]